jgi:predicted ABC-type ATPase
MGINATQDELTSFLAGSTLLKAEGVQVTPLLAGGRLMFPQPEVNSYLASALVDFLRQRLIASQTPFTFETVMSHPGKVAILKQAQQSGFRTCLYYIATNDPEINVSRVRNRVRLGGHPVPEDKIVSRYHRSLELLMEAIRFTHRAFIFDNSGHDQDRTWLAEVTDGQVLELKSDVVPAWFQRAVLDKLPTL